MVQNKYNLEEQFGSVVDAYAVARIKKIAPRAFKEVRRQIKEATGVHTDAGINKHRDGSFVGYIMDPRDRWVYAAARVHYPDYSDEANIQRLVREFDDQASIIWPAILDIQKRKETGVLGQGYSLPEK